MADLTAPFVLGVLGASGGLGASTLAVALAVTAGQERSDPGARPAVAVDGVLAGGGLDVTACVEHRPGLRWGDLSGARGELSGPDLLAALPRACGAPVLSATPLAPLPPGSVVSSVIEALRSTAGLVVVDLDRSHRPPGGDDAGPDPLLAGCDVVLLVAGVTPRHLADAAAARARLTALGGAGGTPGSVGLVVRGVPRGGDLAAVMADHLGLPLAGGWRDDSRVALDAERGRTPGGGRRSALSALGRRLLAQLADERMAG